MTIAALSSLSSASGLITAGQAVRSDATRKAADPFVLPPEDKAPPRAAARTQTEVPEGPATQSQRLKPQVARDEGRDKADPAVTSPDADSAPNGKTTSSSLVNLQEANAEGETASSTDKAESTTAAGDAMSPDEASSVDAVAISAQLAAAAITAPDIVAAVPVEDGAQLGAAVPPPAGGVTVGQVAAPVVAVTDGAEPATIALSVAGANSAGTSANMAMASLPGDMSPEACSDLSSAAEPATGASAATLADSAAPQPGAAKTSNSETPAAGQTGSQIDPAIEKAAEQTTAAVAAKSELAAKNELVARLDQTFNLPQSKPAEIAQAPLPPQTEPHLNQLPKAIPPSAIPMEIGLRSLQGLREFQIRLDPAELGRVDVKLEISDDNKVTARVVVDRVETLLLLQREAKTLERAFEQAGLKSSDAGVDITLRDPGQQADQGRRDSWFDETENGGRAGRAGKAALIDQPVIPIRRTLHIGALDLSI